MALATRELELVIIARDRASATLARVGGALTILGAGAARVGLEGVGAFAEMTKESIDFRKQIALAFTQAEIKGLEYVDVLNLVRDAARNTSVPIEELTDATFDIFSTITLDNIGQASDLLDTASQSAVAGQAPIRDITRAMLAWLNALDLAPTAENASLILDRQFELVRKGAGTYAEFADVIGLAIPAFVNANQGVDELSGTIAFLTRNGQDAAQASAAARRGIELLFSPKAIKNLTNLGIELEDSNGKFRRMDDILHDIVAEFEGLSDAEKKLKFNDIFGTGSIQARRFFDLILQEGNFEEFLFIMDEVRGSAGAVAEAFDIMAAEPAVQLEHMRNRFVVLRQEIGDAFIPFLTGKLLPRLDQLLDWWEDLDEVQRNNLVQWAAYATVFVTIAGSVAAVTGSIILIIGLLKSFAGSAGLALLLGGGIAGAVAVIAGAATWAIADWESFADFFGPMWETLLEKANPIISWLEDNFPAAVAGGKAALEEIGNFIETDWPVIWENLKTIVINSLQAAAEAIRTWFDDNLRKPVEDFIDFVELKREQIGAAFTGIFDNFFTEIMPIWNVLKAEFGPTMTQLAELALAIGRGILTLAGVVVKGIDLIWNVFGTLIVANIATFVEFIAGMIQGLGRVLEGGLNFISGILAGDWALAWEGAKDVAGGAADIVGTQWDGLVGIIGNHVEFMQEKLGSASEATGGYAENVAGMGLIYEEALGNMDTETETHLGNIEDYFNDLGGVFDTMSADADRAMLNQATSVSGLASTTSSTASSIESSLSRIRSAWWRTQSSVRDAINATRYYYPRIDPGKPSSPPPVREALKSLDRLSSGFTSELSTIEAQIRSYRRTLTDNLSFDLSRSFAEAPVGISTQGPATQIGTQIGRQVQVDKVISQADPREIATEIAWQELNS